MTNQRPNRGYSSSSSWIWLQDEEVVGMKLDVENEFIHYYRHVGSLCGDDGSFAEHTIEAYLQQGALSVLGNIPEDVNEELREILKAHRLR